MWSKICQLVPCLTRNSNHSKVLADLEILLCSGLESRHRSIVNASIQLWNSTFGASKVHLAYPSNIKAVLLSLHRVTELVQLPFFPESLESDGVTNQHQLPKFADTQGESSNLFGSTGLDSGLRVGSTSRFGKLSPSSSTRLLRSYTPQVLIEVAQSVPLKRSRESTPDSSKRKSRHRSVAPKLRHDDSQVQFEAIDSSPINVAVLDSQLLTDRQKEVKERQKVEAAMFPDLRSSPRHREKCMPNANSELPLHRSASRSRAVPSPSLERETTPTIAPQVDYDEYVNSSPTPTRSLRDDTRLPDLPSSPREAAKEEITTFGKDEMDIPSSPPEMPQDIEFETTTSMDPSAQVDAVADENGQDPSTFENTSHQQIGSSILETPAPPESPKSGVVDATSIADAAAGQPSIVTERAEIQDPIVGTPLRGRENSPGTFQTPRSEVFHDARTSPPSSDKHTVNEDVFEDTVSSPRLILREAEKQQDSSPISYLDESSAMRMMAGYDQGSGQPRRSPRNARTRDENQDRPASPTSKSVAPQIASNLSEPLLEPQGARDQRLPVSKDIEVSSPMPSLIPETPGPKADSNTIVVDGEELNLDETIIVDTSILQHQEAPISKRKRRLDMISDGAENATFKKGKHQEAVDANQLPDQQEVKPGSKCILLVPFLLRTNSIPVFSPKKIRSPKKRGRGRPKRMSSVLAEGSQPSPSQSFSSVHREGSIQEPQEMEVATEAYTSSANDIVEERPDISQTMEELPTAVVEESELAGAEGDGQRLDADTDMSNAAIAQNTSDLGVVADTIIGESHSLKTSSSASGKPDEEAHETVMSTSNIIAVSSEPVDQVLPVQVNNSVQTEEVVGAPSADGVKAKLQSIIGDLGTITLSRDELNELEDMFMDAKQQLYGARQRGRAGS